MGIHLDKLVKAIHASGMSRNAIARESGLSVALISRILSGERGVSLDNAGRIAKVIGYEVKIVKKRGSN